MGGRTKGWGGGGRRRRSWWELVEWNVSQRFRTSDHIVHPKGSQNKSGNGMNLKSYRENIRTMEYGKREGRDYSNFDYLE